MKVAVVFDSLGPYHIARLNAASKVLDLVAVELAPSSNEYAWVRQDSSIGFEQVSLFSVRPSSAPKLGELVRRLGNSIEKSSPGVIVVPGWSSNLAFAAFRYGVLRRVPLVLMSESGRADERRVFWKEWAKALYLRRFKSALVGGQRHVDYLTTLGMPRRRIFLGYDAVDNCHFAKRPASLTEDSESIRRQHSLPENFFLASARFIKKKNLDRLLECYSRYRQTVACEPWGLVILGDGSLRIELESMCHKLRISESVLLPGFKQYHELPLYYHLANSFVHASTVEQWGLVVNEAMASGLPVIVSKQCGCAPELVLDGHNGLTFDAYDKGELIQCLVQMTMLPVQERARMGCRSQEIVSRWGPGRFANGLLLACEVARNSSFTPVYDERGEE